MRFLTAIILALAASTAWAQTSPDVVPFDGAVYAMSNDFSGNSIVAYGQNADGTLALVGVYPTGGDGAAFDGGEGLDPLISAYSLIATGDSRFLLAVNAGSNTLTVLEVRDDFTLAVTDTASTLGVGPNSIAIRRDLVYVANIDADGLFAGEPDQEGNLTGFRLTDEGRLLRLPASTRALGSRPSAIQFSPDGKHLVVSSINAGSSALTSGSDDELVVFAVNDDGLLSGAPVATGASTLPGNGAGRNLPSAIGFEIVEDEGASYVVVTEAREFRPDGSPPTLPTLQTGSVSTWELAANGALIPTQLDVLAGNSFTDGERTACWIEFSADQDIFWVSNALESTLSTFSFNAGQVALVDQVAAAGNAPSTSDPFGTSDGWIDLWISADGNFLYQLFGLAGAVGVFEITPTGLNQIQLVSGNLPLTNTQGIVAVSRPRHGAVFAMSNDFSNNQLVAYAQNSDGTLDGLGAFDTGGAGAAFDGGEGLDPLISAYAVVPTADDRHVLAVNAGSATITAFRVNDDFSLTRTGDAPTLGVGPNSIATHDGLVYVSNIDADGVFAGEPDQEGSVRGFRLDDRGRLLPIFGSTRLLGNRPSAIQFSPDGRFLVVSSINAGSSALASGSADELVVYAVLPDGSLSAQPVGTGASTLPGNGLGRNLPSAIGFEIVEDGGDQFVVVTEAREFQSDGSPPTLPNLQTGSVSTFRLENDGSLSPLALDVLAGDSPTDGQRTACWIEFSADGSVFHVSNALDASLSTYSFNAGSISLIEEVAAAGAQPSPSDPFGTSDGWIDLWRSSDGRFIYQLFGLAGAIGVYETAADGSLTEIEIVTGDLPVINTQGIVAVGPVRSTAALLPGTGDDLVMLTSTGLTQPNAKPIETARPLDFFNLSIATPQQTLVGVPLFLGVESITTGGNLPTPLLDGFHLSNAALQLIGDSSPLGPTVIPPLGLTVSFQVPFELSGLSLLFQAVVVPAPLASNGLFATTDAHILETL